MSQYALGLRLPPVFLESNFMVSACNEAAFGWITRWPEWGAHATILYGEAGCGKTHLGHIWMQKSRGSYIDAAAGLLPEANHMSGHAFIDNADKASDARALLHLINYSKEHGYSLLMAAALPPAQWAFTLPDLTSRLKALPALAIAPPDDAALSGALRKQFADRQLKVPEDVISYLAARMERSFTAAQTLAETLDAASMAEGKPITVPFAKRVLPL